MSLVPASTRSRRAMLTATGVVTVGAVATALALNTGPAAATISSLSGAPTCDCVVKDTKNNTYRAVFGYVNDSKSAGTIAAGSNNKLELAGGATRSTDGKVTTTFQPGTHKASFATGWISKETTVTWWVGGKNVAAHWNRPTCGKDVSLPAGGNGSGPLIAFVGAAAVAGGVVVWRKRRAKALPQ